MGLSDGSNQAIACTMCGVSPPVNPMPAAIGRQGGAVVGKEGVPPPSTDLPASLSPPVLLPCTHRRTWSLESGKHRGLAGTPLAKELVPMVGMP